jgi:hypothetical protein
MLTAFTLNLTAPARLSAVLVRTMGRAMSGIVPDARRDRQNRFVEFATGIMRIFASQLQTLMH